MEEKVSICEIINAYDDCSRKKKNSSDYHHFSIDAEYELYKLYNELNNDTYKPSKSKAFLVHKPKDREVFAAEYRDRVVQHLLIIIIKDGFESNAIDNLFSCRNGKGVLYGINKCYEEMSECSDNFRYTTYIGKFDIKSFFMSIDKHKMWECLECFIDKYILEDATRINFTKKLTKIILFDDPSHNCVIKGNFENWKCLPKNKTLFFAGKDIGIAIGNITSQFFANIFLALLDIFVKKVLCVKYYGRFVDYFYLISRDKGFIIFCMKEIDKFLRTIGLELHPNKIYIQEINKGVEFLGVIIKPYRKYIKNLSKGNFFKKIKEINYYLGQNYGNVDLYELRHILSVINSHLGYLMRCNTYNLRKKALSLENTENIRKYFSITSNYNRICLDRDYNYCLKNVSRIKERFQANVVYG